MARIVTVGEKDIKVALSNLHPYNLYKLCMQTVAIIIDINATLNPTQQAGRRFLSLYRTRDAARFDADLLQ